MNLQKFIKPIKLNPLLIKQWNETKFKQVKSEIPYVMMNVKDSLALYNLDKSKDQSDAILNNLLKTNVKTGYTFAKLIIEKHQIHPLLFSVMVQSVLDSKSLQFIEPMISAFLKRESLSGNDKANLAATWLPFVIRKAHKESLHYINGKISKYITGNKLELDQSTMDLLIDSLAQRKEYFKLKGMQVDDDNNLKYQTIMVLCLYRNKLASSYHLINLYNDLELGFRKSYTPNVESQLKYKHDKLNSLLFGGDISEKQNQKIQEYVSRKSKLEECFERIMEYLLYRLDDEFAFEQFIQNRKLSLKQSTIALKYFCKQKNIELVRKYYQPSPENTPIYFRYLLQNGLKERAKEILNVEKESETKQELAFEYNIHSGNYYYHSDLQKRKLFRYFYRNKLYPQLIQLCTEEELVTKEPIKEMAGKDYARLIDALCYMNHDYSTVTKVITDNNLDASLYTKLLRKHSKTETPANK
ncbi:hypothetical protein HDV01_004629 [Terramyces sp. JEL0728]|nr:hypothetical protein HDV01_004629 [Terramyces sp. JEL0728]